MTKRRASRPCPPTRGFTRGAAALLFAALAAHGAPDGWDALRGAGGGEPWLKVSRQELTLRSVSPRLCGSVAGLGGGCGLESMWAEMLSNRSFEPWPPLTDEALRRLGADGLGDVWTNAPWYHSGYASDRWYACPGRAQPGPAGPETSFLVGRSTDHLIQLAVVSGGVHGAQALRLTNPERERWGGVAQDGKFLRRDKGYRFRGYVRALGRPAEAELRVFATRDNPWTRPLARIPLGAVPLAGRVATAEFRIDRFEGPATFSLWVSPGSVVELDALSLMPDDAEGGWRHDALEVLRRINPRILRFPDGYSASFYVWRDAIGPIDARPAAPSCFWGGWAGHDLGTKEFLDLCALVDAEPLLVVNLYHPAKARPTAPGPPRGCDVTRLADPEAGFTNAADWVAYCNGPSSHPLGRIRVAQGHPDPYGVKLWELDPEAFRWFQPDEYARAASSCARAMRDIDPSLQIGLAGHGSLGEQVKTLLELAGNDVDFLADGGADPAAFARRIGLVREWKEKLRRPFFYVDTGVPLYARGSLDPWTSALYATEKVDPPRAWRMWSQALAFASKVLEAHRAGDEMTFLCLENLANHAGMSAMETPREGALLTATGYVLEMLSRSPAAWVLRLEGYAAAAGDTVQVQAAWDFERRRVVLYLLNRGPTDGRVTFDLSDLRFEVRRGALRRLAADSALAEETARSRGNIRITRTEFAAGPDRRRVPVEAPKFSLTEVILE